MKKTKEKKKRKLISNIIHWITVLSDGFCGPEEPRPGAFGRLPPGCVSDRGVLALPGGLFGGGRIGSRDSRGISSGTAFVILFITFL